MKFISGIKKEYSGLGVSLKIPIYHRTSISFFNRSEAYYFYRTYQSNNFTIGELILTPIKPEIWHHIRKVSLNAIDRPGVINAITSKLRDLKINVNIVEALTTEIGALHTITLIIDISIFIERHKNNYNAGDTVPKEAIEEIENILKTLKYANTEISVVHDEQVSVKELTFLESISNTKTNSLLGRINSFQFHNAQNQKVKMAKGHIELKDDVLKGLNIKDKLFFYSMFSDTEEKYIKTLFFDPNQTIVFIDILHQDVYGAIAKFTEIIHESYQYNILASYSHQQMQKVNAQWFALIDISNKKQEFFTKTLDALRTAEYGEIYDRKKVLEVFLIETNMDTIPEDATQRFGQNKKTKEGEETSIYIKKKEIIKNCLDKYSIASYQNFPDEFVKHYNFHGTDSLKRLVNKIINEEKQAKANLKNKIISWAIIILISTSLVFIITSVFDLFGDKLIEHAVFSLITVLIIILISRLEKIVRNKIEKSS
jgi:hypothetical protein